ncbi:MAG: efflux RND transporter permease subunit [Clostridia bacterium]|nr:efflux RND transporter permease subunit [Clostridia bacterium]
MINKIAQWEARHPKTVVLIALLLIIPSVIGFIGTRVNYDILSYLPEDLESMQGEEVLDKTFNNAGMSIVIVEDMPAKYTEALKEEISEIDGVSSVMWTDDIIGTQTPVSALPDVLKNIFYSADGNKTMMLVKYTNSGSSDETLNAIKQIKKISNEKTFISGVSAITEDTKELADSQAPIYIAVAILIALVIMSVLMESWILPLVILAALGIAIIYNMGTNIFMGSISFITQAIAAILQLGVTMDYSIFLIDRYEEEKLKFTDRCDAMASAVTKSFTALIGSSLTTLFGFVALCFMQLKLGFDIGFVMAKGVVFGILTVILILPEIILLCEKAINKYHHKNFIPRFGKLNGFVYKHRRIFAIMFVVLLIPAYFVQSKADVYYNLSQALPDDLVSIQGLNTLKTDFNMATTQFVIIDDSVPSGKLTQMEDEIKNLDGISSVIAYNSIIGPAVPDSIMPEAILKICKQGGKQMIMVNSTYNAATDELNSQIDKMEQIVKSYDENALITGEGALSKDLVTTTDRDFLVTSILSVAAIFILIAICFKSLSVPILLVLSIELAIWINLSISTLMGTEISFVSPTIINCVQLGATVDYAILLTTRFREEIQLGRTKKEAILNAAEASERSILQSASVFFGATFGVYLICDISLIKGICALLARGSIISALVIIFFLTPILYVCEGVINKTSLGWRRNKKQNAENSESEVKTDA